MRLAVPRLLTGLALVAASALLPVDATGQVGTVRGSVFDSTTMRPLGGARIVVMGTTATAWSDDDGTFEVTDVPAGKHPVAFFHARLQALGLGTPSTIAEVPERGETEVELTVPSEATLLTAWCAAERDGARSAS